MNARTKLRTTLLILSCLAVLAITAPLFLFREPSVPRLTATFIGTPDSLRPTLAEFNVTNLSSRLVHFTGYQFVAASIPQTVQIITISPGEATTVSVSVPQPIEAHTHVELIFRREDTMVEEAREMLDSVLRSARIRIPGLNPNSEANLFRITATIPKNLVSPPAAVR